ncbi:MAG: cache domain-containing protein, partial [Deltaproteobacteria bacterium]|nr:cache domain-containing protein [Deltaproteobacteria bacterium]
MAGRLFKAVPVGIVLPVVLTVVLFVATIFFLILPMLEAGMMAGKRETIRELTAVAHSLLAGLEAQERDGRLTREEAQSRAVTDIRQLRYGPELKDYFWINDLTPRMLVHPYRPDLEGRDVSQFTDPQGKRIFQDCVAIVSRQGAGYVDYSWQWKDDPGRILPKISYVREFAPWGWIVGTGIYVEDVRAEIGAITRKLSLICLAILAVIVGLSAYVIWQGLVRERQARLHQAQLYQADKMASLGTLVSGVAHEINNPIMSIMLNAPILEKAWKSALPVLDAHCSDGGDFAVGAMPYSQLRERIPDLLAHMSESASRVKSIVSDLKDFARQNPGEMADWVDLNQVAKKAVGLVANLIKKSAQDFNAEYAPELPRFTGNSQRMEQVVINLLVNACQAVAGRHKGITVAT